MARRTPRNRAESSGNRLGPLWGEKPEFAGEKRVHRRIRFFFAMQKVVGLSPISRFREVPRLVQSSPRDGHLDYLLSRLIERV